MWCSISFLGSSAFVHLLLRHAKENTVIQPNTISPVGKQVLCMNDVTLRTTCNKSVLDGNFHHDFNNKLKTSCGQMETIDGMDLWSSESSETVNIYHANDQDVIYGRGNHLKKHPGNKHYRSLIQAIKEYYVMFPKDKKKIVSRLIYDTIQGQSPPGRFLAEIQAGQYIELEIEDVIRKVSQCLREKQTQIIKDPPRRKKRLSDKDLNEKIKEMRDILDNVNRTRGMQNAIEDTFSSGALAGSMDNTVDISDDSKPRSLLSGQNFDPDVFISNVTVTPYCSLHDKHLPSHIDYTQSPMNANSMPASWASYSNDTFRMKAMGLEDRQLSLNALNNPTFKFDVCNPTKAGSFHRSNAPDSMEQLHSLQSRPRRRYSRSLHYDDIMTASAIPFNTKEGSSVAQSNDSNVLRLDHNLYAEPKKNSAISSVDSSNSIHSLVQYYADSSVWHQNISEFHPSSKTSSYTNTSSPKKKSSTYSETSAISTTKDDDILLSGNDVDCNKKSAGGGDSVPPHTITSTGSLDYSNHILDLLMMSASFLKEQGPMSSAQVVERPVRETKEMSDEGENKKL